MSDSYLRPTLSFSSLRCLLTLIPLLLLLLTSSHAAESGSNSVNGETLALTEAEQTWLKEHPHVRVGVMASWPPFNFVDKQGVATGIGADYVAQLNQRLEGVLELVPGE